MLAVTVAFYVGKFTSYYDHTTTVGVSRATSECVVLNNQNNHSSVTVAKESEASQKSFLRILAAEASKQQPRTDHLDTLCDLLASGFAYNTKIPTTQAAADLLSPWISRLPDTPAGEEMDIGQIPLFGDPRISKFLERVNVMGKHVLELGSLEGGHSFMLSQAGATVTGIEGSPLGYLKTLLIKDAYDLANFKPVFGNLVSSLEVAAAKGVKFDALLASGVLYHMTEPMKVLHLMSQVTDEILVWTHYYDKNRAITDPGRSFDPNTAIIVEGGITHTPHCFQYTTRKKDFIGGQETGACLLDRKDMLEALQHWGFEIEVFEEFTVENHPGGAVLTYRAHRSTQPVVNR